MELRHLRYFVAVAEELHFGHAAARLHISQPPLSQQIIALERELGAVLLLRTQRRVELTEAGRVFLEEARRTLAQADLAADRARRAARGEVGRIRIGLVDSATFALLPTVLPSFRASHPGVRVELHELPTAEQLRWLGEGLLEVGFVHPPVAGGGIEVRVVMRERWLIVLPGAHPLAAEVRVPLRALSSEPFILGARRVGAGAHDQVIAMCAAAGFVPAVAQEATERQTIVALVAAGVGVALLPESVRRLRHRGVVYRHIADAVEPLETAVVYSELSSSLLTAAFVGRLQGLRSSTRGP